MIPFASQRGGGRDLATHLLNAHDNEDIELHEVRGAVARDLHGAFAEWEAIAMALTRARQYLCSLSVNPDERQGRLTRAQYLDYIERAEERLGLSGQPRAVVFHRKWGEDGRVREHCHVVWSRTDVERKCAIPLSFFKEKLMTVTREFARDHGLTLPEGYQRHETGVRSRNRQLSAYDCVKQKETGISHAERVAAITDAWRRSDSPEAFVAALEDLGYLLARGRNETRLVLVDFYGHTTALTRLIDDPSVRAWHVREFLAAAYSPEDLPSAEEAQEQAAQRRMVIEAFERARQASESVAALIRSQAARRAGIEANATRLRWRQHSERVRLAITQKVERHALKAAHVAAMTRIRAVRMRRRPRGLAAFLGRVSGVALIIRKARRHRDRKRYAAYLTVREAVKRRQQQERQALADRHASQAAEIQRRLRALDQVEERELRAQAQTTCKERRERINARHAHMPPLAAASEVAHQGALSSGTRRRQHSALARQLAAAAALLKSGKPPLNLPAASAQVSGTEGDGDGDQGSDGSVVLAQTRERKVRARLRTDFRRAFALAAAGEQDEGEAGGDGTASPKVPVERRSTERSPGKKPTPDTRVCNQTPCNGETPHKEKQDPARIRRQRRWRARRKPYRPR